MNFLDVLENGLLPTPLTPESVALFFRNTPGLNKKKIGDYFGEREEFNIAALHCFITASVLEFHTEHFSSLVSTVRAFMESFRLPGEAQKIARIFENFAQVTTKNCLKILGWIPRFSSNIFFIKWCCRLMCMSWKFCSFSWRNDWCRFFKKRNRIFNSSLIQIYYEYHSKRSDLAPNEFPFDSADGIYVMCYSIAMLNTDLHNAQVKVLSRDLWPRRKKCSWKSTWK